MSEKRLYRSCKNRMIGGVCGGIGEYFEIDPVLIRLIFVLLLFTSISFVLYLIAWIIIPEGPNCQSDKRSEESVEYETKENDKDSTYKPLTKSNVIIGSIIAILGLLFLIQNISGINVWANFWPVILIGIGLMLILSSTKEKK
ncbi:MAG: PspC domain-containing protein [Patescibacteria group bacterium]